MSQQDSKRHCPKCQYDNDRDAIFCGRCGNQFTRYATGSTTDIRRPTTTLVDNVISATIPTLYSSPVPPKKRNTIRTVFLAVLAVLLVSVLILGITVGINIGRGSGKALNTTKNTPTAGVVPTSGNTPVLGNTPSATVIPSPTSPPPTPTTPPISCTPPCVLYQAGDSSGWSNWAFSSDWRQVANGLVISDGGGSPPSAVAPYTVSAGINFAIEAEMMTPNSGSQWWEYGIAACGSTQGNQWTGYVGRIAEDYGSPPTTAFLTRFSSTGASDFGQHVFDPGAGWHTFRLEVKGNSVTFKVDGAPVVQATDEEFLSCGNQVGFYDGGGVRREVEVKSFKVLAI